MMKLSEYYEKFYSSTKKEYIVGKIAQLEAEIERLRENYKGVMSLLAMIIHNNGGELEVQTVMLRGDEEIIKWDDGIDLHLKLRTPDALLEGSE